MASPKGLATLINMKLRHYRFRRTTLLLWFSFGVLAGLGASFSGWFLPLSWAIAGSLLILIGRCRLLGMLSVIILGLSLGSLRGHERALQLQGYNSLYDQKISLQVTANEDAVYGKFGQLTFVGVKVIDMQSGQRLPGQIGVSGLGPLAIYQDDVIVVQGKLRSGVGSYQGFMSYGKLEIIERHPSLIASARRQFGASMLSVLPEPTASFAMGLLIGQRATLPLQVKDDLQRVGLTHIIAVSGANLTIMLEASRRVLGKKSKRMATGLSLGLMLLFVAMTGGSASIVRAAFVSGLSVMAAYYGRQPRPLLIITLVAALTAYINPIYVWNDASWWLSFLAFFGVLMVSPLFHSRLPKVFGTNILLAIAVESLCAEIMSLPYILFVFGQMSFVGLIANVLVVSFIPYAMLLSLIAGLAGWFFWPIAGWLAWPAKFLLIYMLDMAHMLAERPGVFLDSIWLPLPGLIFIYVIIGLMIYIMGYKDRLKSAIITDRNQFEPHRMLGRIS